jgi:hypothetical protein
VTKLHLRADAHVLGSVALLAEAARVEDVDTRRRIITGTVVPYGEPGRTNLGLRAVRPGAVRFRNSAAPHVIGIYGHDRERTVSRLVAYENLPDRLRAQLRVATTPLGDQLLAEAAEGVRSMLSIEMDGLTVDPATGDIVDGLCEFVAHVPIGAYDSARVDSVAAQSHPITGNGDDVNRRHLARSRFGREFITVGGGGIPAPAPAPQQPAPAPQAAPSAPQQQAPQQQVALQAHAAPQQQQEPAPAPQPAAPGIDYAALASAMLAAGGTQQLQAHAAPQQQQGPALPSAATFLPTSGLQSAPQPREPQLPRLASLQAAVASGQADGQLRAALADITNSDLPLFQRPAGIGEELWSGGGYTRRFVPLFTQRELTSWKFGGWRWIQGPEVDDYAGDKTDIPTNEVSVEPIEATAQRVAGGWDIDRKFRDFGDAAFWSGFYAAQAESYAEKTDQIAAAALVAAARTITTNANVPAGYVGTNVAQADILRATAYGQAILEDTPNVRRPADFVLMNSADWLGLMDLTNLDLPAFLSLLGVNPASFLRSPLVPTGSVIMGVRASISFYELGGGAPIRVEALDVARAGIDSAVYGYVGTLVNRPGGVISVPLATAA